MTQGITCNPPITKKRFETPNELSIRDGDTVEMTHKKTIYIKLTKPIALGVRTSA
jgi:hypothetical protein